MPRPGYKNVQLTLKEEDAKALDALGDSRSDVITQLIRQEVIARQRIDAEGVSVCTLIAHVKKELPAFTREQIVNLITDLTRYLL